MLETSNDFNKKGSFLVEPVWWGSGDVRSGGGSCKVILKIEKKRDDGIGRRDCDGLVTHPHNLTEKYFF